MSDFTPRPRASAPRWALAAILCVLGCEPAPAPPHAATSDAAPASPTASASTPPTATPTATSSGAASPALPPPLATGGRGVAGRGVVTSEDAAATRAGVAILEAGGNAVDAAIAVAYALSVTHPSAGSLGGGGFMVVRLADGRVHAIDYREKAPAKATAAANDKQLAAGAHGYLSAPVPGVVAGLELARERFGSKPRKELVAPAVALAKGHAFSPRQALVMSWFWKRIRRDPVLRAVFGRGKRAKRSPHAGEKVVQKRLAETLERVAEHGVKGFYEGPVAKRIERAMKKRGGLVRRADLAAYRAVVREPLQIRYRGYGITTMPPPSMGGVAVASMLLHLGEHEAEGAAASDHALGRHGFVEAAKRAYADRRSIGADPDVGDKARAAKLKARLLDPAYHRRRKPPYDPAKATPAARIVPIQKQAAAPPESMDTTHFSVVDAKGNAVSCTTTLSAAFGAWVMVPETGVILSNAMGGFSREGANLIAPHKRMASSMSPTIITRGKELAAVVGSPGGDTIPSTVTQVIRNLIDHRMTVDQAVERGRIHHQYLPDEIRSEQPRPLRPEVARALERRGHTLKPRRTLMGGANSIVFDAATGRAYGWSDTRKGGLALAAP